MAEAEAATFEVTERKATTGVGESEYAFCLLVHPYFLILVVHTKHVEIKGENKNKQHYIKFDDRKRKQN